MNSMESICCSLVISFIALLVFKIHEDNDHFKVVLSNVLFLCTVSVVYVHQTFEHKMIFPCLLYSV